MAEKVSVGANVARSLMWLLGGLVLCAISVLSAGGVATAFALFGLLGLLVGAFGLGSALIQRSKQG